MHSGTPGFDSNTRCERTLASTGFLFDLLQKYTWLLTYVFPLSVNVPSSTFSCKISENERKQYTLFFTFGKSAFSSSMVSPQHNSLSRPTSLTSLPWLRLSRIAAFTSPAVFIRCAGDNSSAIAPGGFGVESNARSAIVRSSSDKNSGDSSPLGASSSCANCRASGIRPCRMNSINFCCWSLKYKAGFVSRICRQSNTMGQLFCSFRKNNTKADKDHIED